LLLWLSKSAERHRRPPLDLRIGPFAPELGVGVQVPPAGTLGTPLPLAGEFGTHVPVFDGSIPFFGLASFCFAPAPPGLWGSFLLERQNWYGPLQCMLHKSPGWWHAFKHKTRCPSQLASA
jgi:hypothetical protein